MSRMPSNTNPYHQIIEATDEDLTPWWFVVEGGQALCSFKAISSQHNFWLERMKWSCCLLLKSEKWESLTRVQLFATPWTIQSVEFSGHNTGVGSLSLLQGIFPTQGSNPGLPHCRWILYQLSHQGTPRTLEWVAYPFSGRSSWPRNWTGVSSIAGRFFTNWAIWLKRMKWSCCLLLKSRAPNQCAQKLASSGGDTGDAT